MARFGVANRKQFAMATARARSYGLTIKDINAAFGKQLDTFEGSSEAAAKLNSVFGTTINSFELMLETDPVKRMEMLRKELTNQGKTWEKLNVFERNVITSTFGVDEAQAQLVLSSEKERKSLEAKAKERERQIRIDEKWNRGLGSIKETLVAWGPLLDKLMRSASNFIVRLFGGESASKTVQGTAHAAENAINAIIKEIDNATASMKDLGSNSTTSFADIVEAVRTSLELIKEFRDTIGDIQESMFSFSHRDLATKVERSAQRVYNMSKSAGGLGLSQLGDLKELREIEQDAEARKFLERKLRQKGVSKDEIDELHTKVMAPQNDAYIHKSGKIVPISEEDNILVRKDMRKVNDSPKSSTKDTKELVQTIEMLKETINDLSKALSDGQKIVLTDINGTYVGGGLVKKARGR